MNTKRSKLLLQLLEKATGRYIFLKEKETKLPSFMKYDNLFLSNKELTEGKDEDEEVITKPPVTKPKPTKRPSPLTPTRPVVQPKPKSLKK